jgi:hypothetical protein
MDAHLPPPPTGTCGMRPGTKRRCLVPLLCISPQALFYLFQQSNFPAGHAAGVAGATCAAACRWGCMSPACPTYTRPFCLAARACEHVVRFVCTYVCTNARPARRRVEADVGGEHREGLETQGGRAQMRLLPGSAPGQPARHVCSSSLIRLFCSSYFHRQTDR